MKPSLVFFVVISLFAHVTPNYEIQRQYDPKEEDPERIRFVYVEDGLGGFKKVDLFQSDPRRRLVTKEDLTLYLFTKRSALSPDIIEVSNVDLLSGSDFNSSRSNVFLSHGWNNHLNSPVNAIVGPAILDHYDVNLFVIDWSGPANFHYLDAKNAVPIIGEFLAEFINEMMAKFDVAADKFHLVGHSLGAHLVGCAGAKVKGLVKSIVGLDPAGPLYTVSNTENRIDETDGEFVHIIHTNGGWLGFSSSLGHADYYPNGGKSQPGCGIDLFGICAHSRAYEFYAESILTSIFESRLCGSMVDFNKQLCDNNHKSVMGRFHVDKTK